MSPYYCAARRASVKWAVTHADDASRLQHALQHPARAGPAGLHGDRARALGRAPAAGLPDLRARMAGPRGAGRPATFPYPWCRPSCCTTGTRGDADRPVAAAPRLHRRGGLAVADRSRWHPVLPPHRARLLQRPVRISLGHSTCSDRPYPTSLVQLWVPRVELHLFYNTIVFIPMIVAMYFQMFPPPSKKMSCTCAWHRGLSHATS